jgi:hypothetical protein
MRVIKTTVLSVILMASSSLGLIAIAQNRWQGAEYEHQCRSGQTCSYPNEQNRGSSKHCAPNNEAIGGFYVDLYTVDSSAEIKWYFDDNTYGRKNIVSSQRGQNWVSFGNPGVQCFSFTVAPISKEEMVHFKYNFDLNRR